MAIRRKRSVFEIFDDYFGDLEKWAEEFEETLVEKPSWDLKNRTMEPLRDMIVTPTEVIVTVDLPFTKAGTVQVKPVNKKTLQISAKMKRDIRFEDFGITHHRGEFREFYCQTRIPVPVQMDRLRFAIKKGILDIHVPRQHEEEMKTQ
jgi:HSP20 family molecular chaperone IbpA